MLKILNQIPMASSVSADVLQTLRSVLPDEPDFIALHEPRFAGSEWDYVKDCLDTGWVSSVGSYVDRFEQKLAEFCGVSHAVATMNGTAALHLAFVLAGVEAGDEVLVPSLTFVATANAVSYCGAVPHFIDSDESTLGVNPIKLAAHLDTIATSRDGATYNVETGCRIAAIVPMHTFGHPTDMDPLNEVAANWNIPVIEDAAESIGSTYKGRAAGSLSRLAALSFNGNKIVTTGGGGAVLTSDAALAQRAKHLSTTAKQPHDWRFDHDEIGFNYRLPNINAAMGCAQLEQLPDFLAAKRSLTSRYRVAFSEITGVRFFDGPTCSESNCWLNAILLDDPDPEIRDDILTLTNANGIMTRPVWTPLHRLPMYKDCPRMDLSITEELADRIVCIPSSAVLGMRESLVQ